MRETKYETIVRVAHRPRVNLMLNPTAEVSTASVTTINLTDLIRHTGDVANMNPRTGTGFRLVGNAAQSNSLMIVGGDAGALRLGMQVGVQYTVSGNFHIPAALAGTAHANARRIVVLYRIGAGAYVELASPQAPNAAGNTRLSLTFTLPDGTTEAFIRWYHGHASATSAYWHSLLLNEGTSTTYFDGGTSLSRLLASAETGWDNALGLSPSWEIAAGGIDLVDAEFDRISYDRMRVPYVDATITLPYPGDEVWAQLDPRVSRDVILYFNVQHLERDPATKELTLYVSHLPISSGNNGRGKLWLRSAEHDMVTGRVTLRASSGEVRFEDKKRLASTPLNTGATNAAGLWQYALVDVGEIAAKGFIDGYATAAIPAGDRQLWMQGESASRLFEDELSATFEATRTFADDRGEFSINQFIQPPGYLFADFPMQTGDAGTVISASQSYSRENGWADATLVKAQYIDGGGVQQTAYQRDRDGVNRAGKVVMISRAIPSALIAESYTREAGRLGDSFRMSALADFRCRPARWIKLTRADTGEVLTISPDQVTYRIREGLMEIEGHLE